MRLRSIIGVAAAAAAVAAPAGASAASLGTYEQVAWVRRAAANFVGAELRGDGARACSVLNAPLRATWHGRTCAQRWDSSLTALGRDRALRAQLRADARAIPWAQVVVRGNTATIRLPAPLMSGQSRFLWSENCWMLER